jgi:Fic family protein
MCTGGMGMLGSIYDFFTLPSQVREANIRRAIYSKPADKVTWEVMNDDEERPKGRNSVEHSILKLAKENNGVVTASEVALEAGIPLEQAKKDLDTLVSKGFAELRVRSTGAIVYTFPELMDTDAPLEDF